MRLLLFLLILAPLASPAIPDEEKQRGCRELSNKVLPGQRALAMTACLEFAAGECDRIERMYRESCLVNSHSDNAIKFDIDRGNASSCQAALMKRETHRTLCDGLRRECRETKTTLVDSTVEVNCRMFRDEDYKRICVQVEADADRIIAAEKAEQVACSKYAPRPATPTTTHGADPQKPSPKLPGKFDKKP